MTRDEMQKKMDYWKSRLKEQAAKENEKARKERTHRLITIGAEVEKFAGGEIDIEKLTEYLKQFKQAIKGLKK